jgi:hypothetical protein
MRHGRLVARVCRYPGAPNALGVWRKNFGCLEEEEVEALTVIGHPAVPNPVVIELQHAYSSQSDARVVSDDMGILGGRLPYRRDVSGDLVRYVSDIEDSARWNAYMFRDGDIVISTR